MATSGSTPAARRAGSHDASDATATTVTAMALPTIGMLNEKFSEATSFAAKAGAILREEILGLRELGVGGPTRIVLIDQCDPASKEAMAKIGV